MFVVRIPLILFMPMVVMLIMMGVIGVVILVLVVVVIRVVVRVDAVIRFLPARLGMLPVRLAKRLARIVACFRGRFPLGQLFAG
jgi:hypothetical protein